MLEKTLESPLGSKEIKPVHPKGHQPWIFIGRTDAEGEAPILRPPDAKSLTHLKRPWCWEILKAKEEEGSRGWDGWMDLSLRMLRIDDPGILLQVHWVAKSQTWLSDWTTTSAQGVGLQWVQPEWRVHKLGQLKVLWVSSPESLGSECYSNSWETHSQFAYLSNLLDSEPSSGLPWTKLTAWNYLAYWVKHLTAKGGWNAYVDFLYILSILTPLLLAPDQPRGHSFLGLRIVLGEESAGIREAYVSTALCGTGTEVEMNSMNHWRVMASCRKAVQRLEAGGC